jgi:uncharacterized protein (TIGR02001 family)
MRKAHSLPLSVSLVAIGIVTASSVSADDPKGPQLSFDLTGATNYIFRGVSQTENNPVVFAEAKVTDDHFYVTGGGENVDFRNGTNAEYDFSAGWTPSAAGFNFDLGAIRYGYLNSPTHIDTTEVKIAATHPFGKLSLGGAVFYTGNYFGTHDNGTYTEANASYMVLGHLSVSGAVGRQYIGAGHDYTTWNIGPGYGINKHIAVDLRYYDTNEHELSRLYNSRVVASVRLSV